MKPGRASSDPFGRLEVWAAMSQLLSLVLDDGIASFNHRRIIDPNVDAIGGIP